MTDREAARVLRDAIEDENCAYPGAERERAQEDPDVDMHEELLSGSYDLIAAIRTLRAKGWIIP